MTTKELELYVITMGGAREDRMHRRLKYLGLSATFVRGVDTTEMQNYPEACRNGTFLGHLKLLRKFVEESKADYAIVAEDDDYLHRDLKWQIPQVLADFKHMQLDVLLLGYLIDHIPTEALGFPHLTKGYYGFHDELWGTQMYLLTKEHAKRILVECDVVAYDGRIPWGVDFHVTKKGRRALLYPMLAVEEGEIRDMNEIHLMYHRRCKDFSYRPDEYI
jgi:hypothetical protein